MALNPGTKLGPYEIQSLVGAGGMGEVYRAHDARLDRTVAIKILPVSYSADRDRLQRFAQEARTPQRSIIPTSFPSSISAITAVRLMSFPNCWRERPYETA